MKLEFRRLLEDKLQILLKKYILSTTLVTCETNQLPISFRLENPHYKFQFPLVANAQICEKIKESDFSVDIDKETNLMANR